MTMNTQYAETEPRREEVDALKGATVVEFGSPWCGYCRRARLVRPVDPAPIGEALASIDPA